MSAVVVIIVAPRPKPCRCGEHPEACCVFHLHPAAREAAPCHQEARR